MVSNVVWSPNLRFAVKKFKETSSNEIFQQQAITSSEEKAIQQQMTQKAESINGFPRWY